MGLVYSMQLFLHCLSINRISAVFFQGRYYSKTQIFLVPYTILCSIVPSAFYLIGIKNLKADNGFVCYSGPYLSPGEFRMQSWYSGSSFSNFKDETFDHVIFGFTIFALILDLITIIGIRVVLNTSAHRQRMDLKLSIMMLLTGIIWLWEDTIHLFLHWKFVGYGRFFFLKGEPFVGHCALSLIIIAFNLPSQKTSIQSSLVVPSASATDCTQYQNPTVYQNIGLPVGGVCPTGSTLCGNFCYLKKGVDCSVYQNPTVYQNIGLPVGGVCPTGSTLCGNFCYLKKGVDCSVYQNPTAYQNIGLPVGGVCPTGSTLCGNFCYLKKL
ncbi:unnamed protein product, partial [Mesorhabditis belari]|uniref:Uncharacterized protein n=1 Tax=Mesorhabditis belari TaxID=2138241 RepID=A0AAF3F9R5_9BILA